MIKQLIEDLTFDKISLSQALTRAKIIAYKIKNDKFKEWIISEIGGYKIKELPQYRIISCEVFAELFVPYQGTRTILLDVTNVKDLAGENSFYKMRITQSIATLEIGMDNDKNSQYGYEYFPMELTNVFKEMTPDGDNITAVKRRIQLSEIKYILEQTKQKLLDTLLELNESFPDLENDFTVSSSNSQKVQNIITQNIYGNNSNSNIGVGENINQSIKSEQKIDELLKELKQLGLKSDDTEELKDILKESDNKKLGKKVLNWLGNLSNKAIEKGIELQIPTIIEKIQHFI